MPGNALSPQATRVLKLEVGREAFSSLPWSSLRKTVVKHAPERAFEVVAREGGYLIRRTA